MMLGLGTRYPGRRIDRCWLRAGIVVLLLLLVNQFTLGLQSGRRLGQYSRRVWNTSQGLPQNTVTALLQSSRGYLWVATQGGLARFDGVKFDVFGASDSTFLADPFITALAEDRQGALWIGTRQGLVRRQARSFQQWTVEEGLPDNYVRSLLCDSRGRLWIGTYGGGVALREPGGNGFQRLAGIANGLVRTLYEDSQGDIWIGSSEGLFHVEGESLEVSTGPAGLKSGFIRAIAEDENGRLWVGTEGAGLFYLDPQEKLFRHYRPLDDVISVRSLLRDPHDGLWIGTETQGLIRLREGEHSFLGHSDGLPHDSVLSLIEDGEGSLWVGTRAGLVQLVDGSVTAFTAHEGLGSESVRAIYEDRENRLWVGTEGGGVQVFRDGHFLSPPVPRLIAEARVRSIMQDHDGGLWLGTRRGLLEYRRGQVHHYTADRAGPNEAVAVADNVINALAESPAGTIWIGTGGGGVSRLRDGVFATFDRRNGLSSDRVRVIQVSASGAVWVGTEEGLNRIDDSGISTYGLDDGLRNDFVLAIHEDEEGDLWLGTAGGLSLFSQGRFVNFADANNLLPATVFQILEDDQGHLWLSSPQGIFQIAKQALQAWIARGHPLNVERFTEADGMLTSECSGGSQPAGWKTQDGKLWFPSLRGVAMIDPSNLDRDRPPPLPLIERVTAQFEERFPRDHLQLSPGVDTLEFFFTAPSFIAPSRIHFRYKLEGLNPDWVPVGERRVALFTNMVPGAYRFLVSASHDGQVWSDPPAALDVVLKPRFYQTRWFQLLLVFLSAGLVVALFRYRLRASESRRHALQRLVDEQTEQLRQANEALQRLASVDDLTGLTNHRRFQEELHTEWRRAARSHRPLTLIMIDIDFFKPFNDTYGHLAGDSCLKSVAQSLARRVRREGEVLARYGGEEFVALLPEVPLREGQRLAEEMRQSIEDLSIRHEDSAAASVVTVSAGVASTIPDVRRSPSWLFEAADSALYHAKHSGRNRVVAFSPSVQR